MTYVRPDIYKSIKDNDLSEVIFKDPFSEETRKAKRNLMVASFISVLISILELMILPRFSGHPIKPFYIMPLGVPRTFRATDTPVASAGDADCNRLRCNRTPVP